MVSKKGANDISQRLHDRSSPSDSSSTSQQAASEGSTHSQMPRPLCSRAPAWGVPRASLVPSDSSRAWLPANSRSRFFARTNAGEPSRSRSTTLSSASSGSQKQRCQACCPLLCAASCFPASPAAASVPTLASSSVSMTNSFGFLLWLCSSLSVSWFC